MQNVARSTVGQAGSFTTKTSGKRQQKWGRRTGVRSTLAFMPNASPEPPSAKRIGVSVATQSITFPTPAPSNLMQLAANEKAHSKHLPPHQKRGPPHIVIQAVCRKFNLYNRDCKFGEMCMFQHKCENCGEHGHPISRCTKSKKSSI